MLITISIILLSLKTCLFNRNKLIFNTSQSMVFVLFLSICNHAVAYDNPGRTEIINLLKNQQYTDIERFLQDKHAKYNAKTIDDQDLLEIYRAFYEANPKLEKYYNAWIGKFPKSYPAHLSRGIFYKKLGAEARGDQYASKTTQKQWAGMNAFLEKSIDDLRASLQLNNKPVITYVHIMDIYKHYGMREEIHALLMESLKVSPDNFVVRRKFMHTLSPRWGGNVDVMKKFLAETPSGDLSIQKINVLKAMIEAGSGWVAMQNKEYQKASHHYAIALKLVPPSNSKLMEAGGYELLKQESAYVVAKARPH